MKKELSVSKPETIDYTFDGTPVHFELFGDNVMVNATEMAKIFGKDVFDFMKTDNTKTFIQECLKTENCRFISVEKEEDLFISRQKSGTWMHRILALKFAAWLSPSFELWAWITIDHILFGHSKKMETMLKESAERRAKEKKLIQNLLNNPDYLELQKLQIEERQAAYLRGKFSRQQRDLFEEILFNN